MYYDRNDNKWGRSEKSLWLQGICFVFRTGMRSLHRIQKLFWVIHFEVRTTCTLESLNSGTGKRRIIYVEETVQWVIWMVSRRFIVSCNWRGENVLLVNVLFDMIACWLIHTELNSVLGPKTGEFGLRHQGLENIEWGTGEEILEPVTLFTKSLHTAIRNAG
jgi:hypothetical protein